MALPMMKTFWEYAIAHHMTDEYKMMQFLAAYHASAPPGLLDAALRASGAGHCANNLGYEPIERYCHRDGIGGAAEEMVFAATIAGWTPVCVAADQLVVVSTSAFDDNSPPNTGALRVRVSGINDDGTEWADEVETNGLANSAVFRTVPNPVGCFAINDVRVIESGTPPVGNVGTITVEDTTNARVYEAIQPLMSRVQSCRYHIPAGKRCYIQRISMASEASDTAFALMASGDRYMFAGVDQIMGREMFCALQETGKWEHVFTPLLEVPPSAANTYPSMFDLAVVSGNPNSTATASVFFVLADE